MSSYGWMIAPPPWRRGPQVRAPWHHRAMGPSTSWDQRPRPVTRAVGTQECTQIGQNGLSASFWGIRVHCWAVAPLRAGAGMQECTQIGQNGLSAPFWGVCVHCCAVGLGCGWPWDRNSVHKWEDRAPRRRIRAFVYTVATRVAIRIATRVAPGGTSAPTAMACRRHPSRWAPLPWSGRQTLREWRRREVGVFAEASTHTNPRGANSWASFPTIVLS